MFSQRFFLFTSWDLVKQIPRATLGKMESMGIQLDLSQPGVTRASFDNDTAGAKVWMQDLDHMCKRIKCLLPQLKKLELELCFQGGFFAHYTKSTKTTVLDERLSESLRELHHGLKVRICFGKSNSEQPTHRKFDRCVRDLEMYLKPGIEVGCWPKVAEGGKPMDTQ